MLIEYRVKVGGISWEETPKEYIFTEEVSRLETAYETAKVLARLYKRQVRWEIMDVGQGHYVDPE